MNISKKLVVFIVALVLVLGVGGVWYWQHSNKQVAEESNFINYKDPGLTDSEKAIFVDKLNEYQKKLAEAKDKDDQFTYSLQAGNQYYALGEYLHARYQYLRASTLLPDNPTAWAELYVVENAMTDYESADEHITHALAINPGSAQYWRWKINLHKDYLGANDAELEKLFTNAIEKTNKNVDMITLHAIFLEERKKDLPAAIAEWRSASSVNPDGKVRYEEQIKRIQDLVK